MKFSMNKAVILLLVVYGAACSLPVPGGDTAANPDGTPTATAESFPLRIDSDDTEMWLMKWKDTIEGEHKALDDDCVDGPTILVLRIAVIDQNTKSPYHGELILSNIGSSGQDGIQFDVWPYNLLAGFSGGEDGTPPDPEDPNSQPQGTLKLMEVAGGDGFFDIFIDLTPEGGALFAADPSFEASLLAELPQSSNGGTVQTEILSMSLRGSSPGIPSEVADSLTLPLPDPPPTCTPTPTPDGGDSNPTPTPTDTPSSGEPPTRTPTPTTSRSGPNPTPIPTDTPSSSGPPTHTPTPKDPRNPRYTPTSNSSGTS